MNELRAKDEVRELVARAEPCDPGDELPRLRAALVAAGIGTWCCDLASQGTTWDALAAELLGLSPGTGELCQLEDLVDDEDRVATAAWRAALAIGVIVPLEVRLTRADGRRVRALLAGNVERDASGRAVRASGVVQDVTARRRSERRVALEAAVSRILAGSDTLAEAAPRLLREVAASEGCRLGIIWLVDDEAGVLRAAETWTDDPAAAALIERSRVVELAEGESLPGAIWRSRQPQVQVALTEAAGELAHLAAAAGLAGVVGFPITAGGRVIGVVELYGNASGGFDLDLRALLRTLGDQLGHFVARRKSEALTRRVLALNPNVLYALRIDDGGERLAWVSGNLRSLWGYAPDELGERAAWLARIHPDDRARIEAAPLREDRRVLEYRFQHRDGSYRWVRDELQLVRDHRGRAIEAIGTWSDVTERVRLEELLRQSQKMEAIGVLAGGVAHDFNNLLTVISCSTELLQGMVDEGDPRAELLGEVATAAERGAALTRQLLLFSRARVVTPTVLEPNQLLRGIEKMLRRLIGEDVQLVTRLDPGAAPVLIDAGQLEQVVLNLAVNARDAMPRGGTLTIVTRPVTLDDAAASRHPDARPGRHTCIEVTDTGTGMTPEIMARIFEPFFTTKGVGKGTGLGLATAFGIVRTAGGHIQVVSAPGAGTTFTIYLPATAAVAAAATPVDRPAAGSETILLVEDDPGVRRSTRISLGRLGYRVLEASGPTTALALATAHPEIDLLLTDVVMPEGSGPELAAVLAGRRPDLAVLFMSGYIDDAITRHGIVASDSFLHKPFTPRTLRERVRAALDRRAG